MLSQFESLTCFQSIGTLKVKSVIKLYSNHSQGRVFFLKPLLQQSLFLLVQIVLFYMNKLRLSLVKYSCGASHVKSCLTPSESKSFPLHNKKLNHRSIDRSSFQLFFFRYRMPSALTLLKTMLIPLLLRFKFLSLSHCPLAR